MRAAAAVSRARARRTASRVDHADGEKWLTRTAKERRAGPAREADGAAVGESSGDR